MKIKKTKLKGVCIIELDVFNDKRGSFVKTFHKDTFIKNGLDFSPEESFYSISKKNVIRGMHFQFPQKDCSKLIYVTHGAILDVVLDIRKESKTYNRYLTTKLSGTNRKMIYVPTGCAHGFLSLEDNTCVAYLQSTMHSLKHEGGIRIDSFGMDWGIKKPIISSRDKTFPTLENFKTPFI